MKKTLLFAIDVKTNEVIVSSSEKGSMEIEFIERIPQSENELLFDAVAILTKLTTSPNFDAALFKSLDKVCQMIYQSESGESERVTE
jgi:protease II